MKSPAPGTTTETNKARWEREVLEPTLKRSPERAGEFTTISGRPIDRLYTQDDVAEGEAPAPGEFPYTRGIHPTGYRGKLWTMRQFAGFGTPEETNERYKQLLRAGGTGLSVAFDLPTLMGRDPDHPLSLGEVGKCGVSIMSLADMERLFEGITLADITTSMTINSPAPMIFAMYLVVAEQQGADWKTLSGTIQNDILKEFIAQKEYIFPPRPSMRLITDIFQFCAKDVPKWNTISVSGYHIREAGSTALQELAFTLRDGIEYVQWGIDAGLDVDEFVPRISFFFNAHSDFFEEIAKYRAARKIWARVMRERFGAKDERSLKLRFHSQTAGVSLTAQQPYNNVVRTALQALSAVLGGTNSLHTNSLDEALALPTEAAATLALRTQQVIACESGVTNVVDPLGGSYFIEKLTLDMEEGAYKYFDAIDRMGGMVAAVEAGFPQREIAEASYRYQQSVERGEKIVVGVNGYVDRDEPPFPILYIDDQASDMQMARLKTLRETRDNARVAVTLEALKEAARGADNTMYPLLDCVRAYATVGEMCDALREVWGEYEEVPSI
ncbi:MAG TPA: methylmalonyl-CoA mutase family protein [Vicinamibacterales bacterium]|nr:methylmalonyl-CoA mutase family protein [Acidobacteriota bacterium]HQX82881.1 methylmalonyl-CoA mutase family protein [Vicinamibacterales bacterium]